MKVVVTGANGQLAKELVRYKPSDIDVVAVDRNQLDITSLEAVQAMADTLKPDAIINAAAYTAVDKAEENTCDAFLVNETGIENIAKVFCDSAYVLHVSTDFVFDGKQSRPYASDDKTNPLSVYGKSKLAGEQALADHKTGAWAIIRTSWVYSAQGNNFVNSMIRLMAARPELNIVADQVGTPTLAGGLAQTIWKALAHKVEGVFHWSDAGVASWYDFAVAINELASEYGLLDSPVKINPIKTEQYPLPAARPAYSVMDKSELLEALPSIELIHWRAQLHTMMKELKIGDNS